MPTPGEHKTVQSRILAYAAYAHETGWTYVSRAEAWRGFDRVHDLDLPELTSFTAEGAR